ncbi:MAG TPA: hypothetical protein VFA11_10040 [Acidimicrobiales bacterium]|nr:hypothetical protein [Acidimicrobiales bacterium]
MPPVLTYDELVATIEGPAALPGWRELCRVLEARGGWRFRVGEDALLSWERIGRPWIWATVEQRGAGRPSLFVLWRASSYDPDDADWWELVTARALGEGLDAMELPRRACRAALDALAEREAPRMVLRVVAGG